MTVYDPSWQNRADSRPESRSGFGFIPFLAFLLVGGLLWSSHSSLTAKIQDNRPTLETLEAKLAATEAEVEALRSTLGEQTHDVNALKLGEVYRTPGIVDLGRGGAQLAGHGFAVTALVVQEISGGYLLEGRLINLQAVKHQDLVFSVALGQVAAEFTLAGIEPGQSAPFSIFFDDVGMEAPRFARFDYLESTIWHRASD